MNDARNIRLLMVEDDENDVLLLTRAFRTHCPTLEIEVVMDGEEAVRRLAGMASESLPDRILLDLKLPRRSGIEVLRWIRSRPELRHLSVTLLTSSNEPSDLEQIRELGVDEHIVKPVDFRKLLDVTQGLCVRWGVAVPRRRTG
jgi:CheY-like chemotaxis protein